MASPNEFYLIQPNFVGGEVSPEVASRVDLDKYQMSLLQAENAVIRPYGTVRKRPGLIYCGEAKTASSAVMLYKFDYTAEIGYMLEIGAGYIRIWRDGSYLGVELATPFQSADLPSLRFVQSIDVLYICSGKYPVKKILHYSETEWEIEDIDWTMPAFDELNEDEDNNITPSGTSGSVTLKADYEDTFSASDVGRWIKLQQYMEGVSVNADVSPGSLAPVYTNAIAYGNDDVTFTFSGATVTPQHSDDKVTWSDCSYYLDEETSKYTVSGATSGYYRIKASGFSKGAHILITLTSGSNSTSFDYTAQTDATYYSSSIMCGDTWKIITHGTWVGTVTVEASTDDGETWSEYRKYTGNEDYNPTESGEVDEYTLLRFTAVITSGTCTVDLSSYPYTHIGYAQITAYTDSQTVSATVKKDFGAVSGSADWYLSEWCDGNGYPNCATFFQDRLVLGGDAAHPQRVWMSRSGDYENFEVEKASGTVTDDSAVTADLLSLKAHKIKHMTAGNDLLVFTEGNSWTISGANTVTPSEITPRNQENYGTNDIIPVRVGNRVIYVQRRGSIVRDIGYSYDSDSYAGADLTLLAKHLITDHTLSSGTFAQEPDSQLYFVRDDGVLIVLTYIFDQKVYGWSRIVTDGEFESVCAVNTGNNDIIYTVVRRTVNGETRRYIERFDLDHSSGSQQDYVMMDAAIDKTFTDAVTEITGLSHLEGKVIHVLADGYLFESLTVSDGKVTIPQAANHIIAGLPYTMILEQPNVDAGNTNSGTIQGRKKTITFAILRLRKSFGGWVGPDEDHTNEIVYYSRQMETGEDVLYSGDRKVTLATGGFNTEGRVYIRHDMPYPFNLSAIIRAVTIGG